MLEPTHFITLSFRELLGITSALGCLVATIIWAGGRRLGLGEMSSSQGRWIWSWGRLDPFLLICHSYSLNRFLLFKLATCGGQNWCCTSFFIYLFSANEDNLFSWTKLTIHFSLHWALWVLGRALAPRVSSITNTQLQRRRAKTSDPTNWKIMDYFQNSLGRA